MECPVMGRFSFGGMLINGILLHKKAIFSILLKITVFFVSQRSPKKRRHSTSSLKNEKKRGI